MDPRSKIKFGVLGCSRVAQKGMLPAICDSNFAELAMVGSRTTEKAREMAEQFHCDGWGTYDEVINNKEIDAVYVSLPNSLHEEWTIKAAEKGKHVICEKPAAISYASAKKMVEACRKNNVRLLEGLMFKYHPQHAKVRELIAGGVLGELLRFEGCFGYAMPDKASTMMNKKLGGGSFYASATYPVYASRMVFGEEPESVLCNLKIDPASGVDVRTDMVLRYPNGKFAFISSMFGSYFQSTYSVLGSQANIRMGRAYAVPRDKKTNIFLDADDQVQEIVIEPADQFRLMLDDFCEEILKGAASTKDYENDLLAQARVFEAARWSDQEKRVVRISEIDDRIDAILPEKHRVPIKLVSRPTKNNRVLLTGGAGNLGRAILQSKLFNNILAPSHQDLDITKPESIRKFLKENRPDIIIHSAAVVRMSECENKSWKQEGIETNIIGTCNLIKEVLESGQEGADIRFIYISTDGVYPGTKGNYSEQDETIPYNNYGWTKLGGECAAHLLPNFCIIRTSFFDPAKIKFETSATDMFSSKIPLESVPKAIAAAIKSNFVGTINIGGERESEYERYREFKPTLKPCKREDILKNIEFNLARDASLDSSLWKKIKESLENLN